MTDVTPRADREMNALIGHRPLALQMLNGVAPRLAQSLADTFGLVLGEGGLDRCHREIATIAALTALGDTGPQLKAHGIMARNVGVTDAELALLVHHLLPYVGFPRVLQALTALELPTVAPEHDVRLSTHTTRVTVRAAEGGDPLVLIHAIGLDRRMWSQVIDLLPTDRRIIAYDVRGHGHAADAPAATTLHDHADDLAELLDALHIPAAHIAGLSLGGAIAQTFALDHPKRLVRLDLIATHADPQDHALRCETDGMAAQVVPTLTRWFTPEALAANAWPVRYARDLLSRNATTDWAATWRTLATVDTRDCLGDIAVPTRVIAGELDCVAPPEVMRSIVADIPGAEFVVIPGAPHMISLQNPHDLADLLTA